MNMFARFDENPAMTLRVIKETKRYGRTDGRMDTVKTVYPLQTKFAGGMTDGRTDGQREDSIPPTNKVCGGYNNHGLYKIGLHVQNGNSLYGSVSVGPVLVLMLVKIICSTDTLIDKHKTGSDNWPWGYKTFLYAQLNWAWNFNYW